MLHRTGVESGDCPAALQGKGKFLLSNRTQIPALDGWTGAEPQEFAKGTLGLPRVGGAHLLMTQRHWLAGTRKVLPKTVTVGSHGEAPWGRPTGKC